MFGPKALADFFLLGGYCLIVEFYRRGSASNEATPLQIGSEHLKLSTTIIFFNHTSCRPNGRLVHFYISYDPQAIHISLFLHDLYSVIPSRFLLNLDTCITK